jgi:hypothetical protein
MVNWVIDVSSKNKLTAENAESAKKMKNRGVFVHGVKPALMSSPSKNKD